MESVGSSRTARVNMLLQKENKWIKLLDTMQPKGFNDILSYKCFL